jgi:hypothetical protein
MFTFKPQISEASKEMAEKKKKVELSKYLVKELKEKQLNPSSSAKAIVTS